MRPVSEAAWILGLLICLPEKCRAVTQLWGKAQRAQTLHWASCEGCPASMVDVQPPLPRGHPDSTVTTAPLLRLCLGGLRRLKVAWDWGPNGVAVGSPASPWPTSVFLGLHLGRLHPLSGLEDTGAVSSSPPETLPGGSASEGRGSSGLGPMEFGLEKVLAVLVKALKVVSLVTGGPVPTW